MSTNKKWMALISLVAITAMLLPACAPPTPIVIEKEVTVEVEVIKEVEVIHFLLVDILFSLLLLKYRRCLKSEPFAHPVDIIGEAMGSGW